MTWGMPTNQASAATATDVSRLLGDVDPLVLERILATGATPDEIGEALRLRAAVEVASNLGRETERELRSISLE